VVEPTPTVAEPTPTTDPAADSLSARLATAKSSGAIFKVGSKGDSVKAIQEFLNKYEKKSVTADGDYGEGTATRIKAFQKANALPQTGQTAEKTLTKMIEWLGKN
jgi:peptidoglycan hydrolase-like protein with peptidoglycan-binding domain